MPINQVDPLTKEYHLGAMQGLKQILLNSAARLTGKKVFCLGLGDLEVN